MEYEVRELEVRKVNQELREFTGLAAPYDTETDVGGIYKEKFARGAFGEPVGVKLFYGHNEPIGKIISGRDTDEGFEITGSISKTTRGNDVYEMLRDGALDRLSVGFIPVEHTVDEETGTVTRTRVDLKEVSVVPFPAYDGAKVSEVRADETNANNNEKEVSDKDTSEENMETTTYDDTEIRAAVDNLTRELAVVRENGVQTNTEPESAFKRAGEWGAAYLNGDAKAIEEARDVTVTSDASHFSNDWRGGLVPVITRGRPLVTMFEKNVMPKGHKTAEYLKALVSSGNVAVQSSEGATIANLSGEVETDTVTVSTYAGYVEATFQTIDLTDVDLVDALLRAAAESYAKVTNDAFRTALTGASAQTGTSVTLASADAGDWLTSITDAAYLIDKNATLARSVDFAVASKDVFEALAAAIDENGRPLLSISGQSVNSLGNANPVGLSVSVAGLPVVMDTGLGATSKSLYIASKNAVASWETAGSPFDLQSTNIVNLKKQFALYGYFAAKAKDANGIVKVAIA